MTFMHKLSCRLALLKDRGVAVSLTVLATASVFACEMPLRVTDSGSSTVAQFLVSPKSTMIRTGQSLDFMAVALTSTGDTAAVAVTWSVTSGAITDTSTKGGRHYGRYKSGLDTGKVKVIATGHPNNVADTATVTVTLPPVSSLSVNPASSTVQTGKTVQLTAATLDSAGNVLTGRTVTWSSSSTATATVSASGLVSGVAVGSTTITATSEGQSGTAAVTVTSVPVVSVTVTPAAPSVLVGQTVQLTATPKDANGNPLSGRTVTWSSGNLSVATVNGSGLVRGVTAGSATITATCEGQSGTVSATVTSPSVASVTVSPAAANLGIGTTLLLTATLKDSVGNVLTGRTVAWTSNASGVATVDASGLVTGVTAGAATITATSGAKSGTAAVTVTASSASPITDPWVVLTEPTLPKPASLTPIYPTPMAVKVMRTVGDPGTAIAFTSG